jgi:hypothetical protein
MALTIEGPTPRRPKAATADIVLTGEVGDAYVKRLVGGIRAARLNAFFPPAQRLRAHLGFLGAAGSDGVYDEVRISPVNGLPTPREILRVKIDRDLARGFLEEMGGRKAPRPDTRLARKVEYYNRLAYSHIMAVNRMQVELRQQIPAENLALFRVTLDRFDLSMTQFVRYTILLRQRDRFWRRDHVHVDDSELAAPTEGFRRIVSRFAADEAEVAFVLLSKIDGIEVEDVRRCRVGPLMMTGMKVGEGLEELLVAPTNGEPPPWILCFPEDRAGIEVAASASRDPLAELMRDAVGVEAGELMDAKADELGYRVAKSRKFVCPRALVRPLSELCKRVGAPSIVRAARG